MDETTQTVNAMVVYTYQAQRMRLADSPLASHAWTCSQYSQGAMLRRGAGIVYVNTLPPALYGVFNAMLHKCWDLTRGLSVAVAPAAARPPRW